MRNFILFSIVSIMLSSIAEAKLDKGDPAYSGPEHGGKGLCIGYCPQIK